MRHNNPPAPGNSRHQSYFYNLRRYHNWIKRNLIDKYAFNIDHLLDLASGKGGDLSKWVDAKIKHVRGYDIHRDSVIEARRRLSEYNNKLHVSFDVIDLSLNVLPKDAYESDVVTSMFAFHYFFKSPDTLDTVLQSIENNLKIGGYFVCCMFDGESVVRKLNGNTHYETQHFKLTRKSDSGTGGFGNTLGVLMKETVLDEEADEYIVDSTDFIQLMKWRGFELVESKMFSELYIEWSRLHRKNNMKHLEKDVSFLNRYYVFKKKSNIASDIACFHSLFQ